jgi:hypothetical protein
MNPPGAFADDAFGAADSYSWEPQPVCWPRLDAQGAFTAWHALDGWTRWCVRRYGLDHRTVPPCWYLHGAVVEELSALHTAWQAAHSPAAPGSAPLDWHAMFAMARQRLQDWVARSGCRSDEHRPQQATPWVNEPDAEFPRHVIGDCEHRTFTHARRGTLED